MHLRHIDPRSLEWKDAMLDETRPGFEADSEQDIEAADEMDSRQSMAPPTQSKRPSGLAAPPR
jgi:hypothetical protein